ncbi:hypothetical protein AB6A40_010055 [Gnathostoma spinigerum]|uniref:Uncharacterized protein n=1 Tax=Gnathostoma spinigerum TaxID=75299 RepID=A0ABD6EU10_9BILA
MNIAGLSIDQSQNNYHALLMPHVQNGGTIPIPSYNSSSSSSTGGSTFSSPTFPALSPFVRPQDVQICANEVMTSASHTPLITANRTNIDEQNAHNASNQSNCNQMANGPIAQRPLIFGSPPLAISQ